MEVLTHQGHIQREFAYWARNTVAAFVLGLGALIGFLAGIMVVYQIIYADVSDHLPEFATLMAMGYPLRQLALTLVMEGVLLALLAMAMASALLCLGKLCDADPAEIF